MSKSGFRVARAVIAVGSMLVCAPSAWSADAQSEADKLIRHGVELRKAHDDSAAAREFQKAYELVRSPRSAGQLGLAEQALGRWEDAERHVGEAVLATGDPWVVKNRGPLEKALSIIQEHLGRVEVIGDPEGAEVVVSGRPAGKLPLREAVRVSAGLVDVDVHAPGYVSAQRNVTIVGGQYQKIVIHLVKERGPSVAETPAHEPVATPAPLTAVAPEPPAAPPAEPAEGPSVARVALKWTTAGLAGAGLATGIIGTVLHSHNVSKFGSSGCRIRDGAGVLESTGAPDPTCQSLLDSYKTDQTVAIIGYVAAGAFAAASLVLFLTEPSSTLATSPREHASRWPLCGPASEGVGLACGGRF